MIDYTTLAHFKIEIIILLSALFLLMAGVYSNKNYKADATAFGVLITLIYSLFLLSNSSFEAPSYNLALFSGNLLYNHYTLYISTLILISSAFAILALISSGKNKVFEVSILILLSTLGAIILVNSNDLMVLYMALEIMSLPLYILIAADKEMDSTEAALKYFIFGAFSSAIFLFGSSLIYSSTGAINFDDINSYFFSPTSTREESFVVTTTFMIGFIMMFSSMAFKVAIVPFHFWAPDVYRGSSTYILPFLFSIPKIAIFGITAKLLYRVFIDSIPYIFVVIYLMAIISIIFGSIAAVLEKNIKKILAYSTISHSGFLMLPIASSDPSSLQAMMIYLTIYVIAILALLGCMVFLESKGSKIVTLSDLGGLSNTEPCIAGIVAISIFSMAGLPPFAGFFAKLEIFTSILKQEEYLLAVIAILATIISLYYYLNIIKFMYFMPKNSHKHLIGQYDNLKDTRIFKGVLVLLAIIQSFYIILPSYLVDITSNTIKYFLY